MVIHARRRSAIPVCGIKNLVVNEFSISPAIALRVLTYKKELIRRTTLVILLTDVIMDSATVHPLACVAQVRAQTLLPGGKSCDTNHPSRPRSSLALAHNKFYRHHHLHISHIITQIHSELPRPSKSWFCALQ